MEAKQILIKSARIIDPASPHNNKVCDVLIEDDLIKTIGTDISTADAEVFQADNLHISPGWFDLRANFGDPGYEEREDLESGINAAIFGGFTGVGISPDTNPPLDSKADIEYIYKKSEGLPVNLFPYGAISKNQEGKELSEMYDMYRAGAVAFSQGKKSSPGNSLLKLAMQYSRSFAPALHLLATDMDMAKNGQMHEGPVSTYLGLKGIPAIAEEIALQKFATLARYAEASVHFMGISSHQGLDILKDFKAQKLLYTADVAVANLYFTDESLESYDTRLKVLPPLREAEDREALIRALNENLIHIITSDHEPQDIESKKCEFDNAAFGATGLESFIGALGHALQDKVNWEKIVELIAVNPRKALKIDMPVIKEGERAEITFFDPDMKWTFEKKHIEGRSANSPYFGKPMKGKALGIYNNGTIVWLPNR